MRSLFAVATALLIATPTLAEELKLSGTACWTGTTNMVAVSETDWSMNWELTATYVDDNLPAENAYVRCAGRGEMIGGQFLGHAWSCVNHFDDGSTMLSTGKSTADGGAEGAFVAGTGRHEGVTGGYVGEPFKEVGKAPEGFFAACRHQTGTKVLM